MAPISTNGASEVMLSQSRSIPWEACGCGAGSLYTVMRAIDDDGDGVGNGTPHAAAIFAALNRYFSLGGIGGSLAGR